MSSELNTVYDPFRKGRKHIWVFLRWPKNWCFWTVVLEKTLESPLDCKEIQPFHSEGDQLWDFFGRNDAKAEHPVLWPPHVKSWLIGKNSDAGRDWGQEEKGTTEDEMAGQMIFKFPNFLHYLQYAKGCNCLLTSIDDTKLAWTKHLICKYLVNGTDVLFGKE